jgi:hypothetical protein
MFFFLQQLLFICSNFYLFAATFIYLLQLLFVCSNFYLFAATFICLQQLLFVCSSFYLFAAAFICLQLSPMGHRSECFKVWFPAVLTLNDHRYPKSSE